MKKALKWILGILIALLVVVGGYLAYVFIAYHRIGDMPLDVGQAAGDVVLAGGEYDLVSWNIGFGAYEADYGFFMDGGTESWAWSKERLDKNLNAISGVLNDRHADFYLVQEVDIDSTRSYHFDEREYLLTGLPGTAYQSVYAPNYDSPFLMYPLTQPHGASKSGIMTFSRYGISEAERVELPIETGLMKFFDLDRCYSKTHIPSNIDDGAELVLYNFHLSAYTSDGTIATEQLKLLLADMQAEYEKGNWCVASGDFNKDLLGDSSRYWGKSDIEYTWAQPIPAGLFDGTNITLIAPLDEDDPIPSCRNADSAYHKGQYVLTIDGFLVSDNVTAKDAEVIDTGFAYSDHNPVRVTIELGR